jgi:hypothetical protein
MRRSTHMKRCALLSRQPIREGSRETGRGSRAFAAKQLTETLTRLLVPRVRTADSKVTTGTGALEPAKVAIFLSHAKADGRVQAQRLRDYIYSQTQMAAFYDENDIATGSVFAK